MQEIKEIIVVEGRYDKNTVSQVVKATIVETSGFGVFSDKEKLALLRRFAEVRGLIILTDSDGAGFIIRNYLKSALPKEQIKQAYIPDIYGKERRKKKNGREGKLGVEGMKPQVILEALRRAGATFLGEAASTTDEQSISKKDLYLAGLSGHPDSGEKRKRLANQLGLPGHLNANALLEVLNALYSYEAFWDAVDTLL